MAGKAGKGRGNGIGWEPNPRKGTIARRRPTAALLPPVSPEERAKLRRTLVARRKRRKTPSSRCTAVFFAGRGASRR
ncbi:MAG: hypothetical protein HSCHL_0035 [Hydrogenibacillus schlegelii]|uniref:Uncharacterized protein n=1 Tax=Hydrogenibacillus schlegelii TaxID=1484 RepID=A0A2T5G9A5_HYDSH|nr:MAG: hypothetical protein HSCHL_0035 [Hydrogenibacillus schlegelii]